MAMFESVAMRQKGGLDFQLHYDNLCALSNTCPIPAVKARLVQNVLDLNGDRIRTNDWLPILNTIRINKTLEYIAIRSFYLPEMEAKDLKASIKKLKIPPVRSKELTNRICRALKDCLEASSVLKCIELQGLPLRRRDVDLLVKGIQKSSCLQHLSFENSGIGDDNVAVLCRAIKNTMSITSINFSGCSLGWQSAESIAEIIKHQATVRHSEAWKDSLRYRRPDLDRMAGLRRITANSNPLLGDKGVQALADVLRDDLWVKAVDLHHCGIGEEGAKALLEILKINTTLVVMDVRVNPLIGKETLTNIMDQVCINCAGHETEYKWIKVTSSSLKAKHPRQRKRPKALQNYGRKSVRASSNYLNKRAKSAAAAASISRGSLSESSECAIPGTPWRTAMRAARYKGGLPDQSTSKYMLYESFRDASSPMEFSRLTDNLSCNEMRDVKVELEMLRRSADEGLSARINLEKKLQLLTSENEHLRRELKELQEKRSVLDDDKVLDSIEQSFRQFHSFLDLLRDIGLSQLISMAGLDQTNMPIQHDLGVPLESDRSRNDKTNQMKSFLEQSRLDRSDLSLLSDGYTAAQESIYHRPSIFRNKPDRSFGVVSDSKNLHGSTELHDLPSVSEKSKKTTSKFDELYQKALKNTESILQRKEFRNSESIGREASKFNVETKNVSEETSAAELQKENKIDRKTFKSDDDQCSDRSESVSHASKNRRNVSNKPDSLSFHEAPAKLTSDPQESGHPLTTYNATPEPKILSDRSDKSASSRGTKASVTKLAETMSELQDDRQTRNAFGIGERNESYNTVDEQTISEESNLEEVLDLNDSVSQ